jgi:hypothetical protein
MKRTKIFNLNFWVSFSRIIRSLNFLQITLFHNLSE